MVLGRIKAPPSDPGITPYGRNLRTAINSGPGSVISIGPGFEFRHRDPFDRLLVAQALEEELTLVSSDRDLAAFGVSLRW